MFELDNTEWFNAIRDKDSMNDNVKAQLKNLQPGDYFYDTFGERCVAVKPGFPYNKYFWLNLTTYEILSNSTSFEVEVIINEQ